ncbi:MAG: hypothetical protein JXR80_03455 [Deltaproteobacteria bacterium]|nr:hypothetical protein [Deltaproteobacteria bacterium]
MNWKVVFGAQVTREYSLQSGWNAIYLDIEPDDSDPATVFNGISQIESVWMWNANAGTVEFIQNPAELEPAEAPYLTWLPGSILSNLGAIHGNQAYLIKTTGACTLTVNGEPLLPAIDWKPNSFNLVGFHLDAAHLTTFDSFFGPYPEFLQSDGSLADIYALDGNGQWVAAAPTDMMEEGEAFWIYCWGSSTFTGTLRVQVEQNGRLDFGEVLSMQDIVIYNLSDAPQSVSLDLNPTTFPLYYQNPPTAEAPISWSPMSGGYTSPEAIGVGESLRLRLGVKRAGLIAGTTYEANLELPGSDASKGSRVEIPLSVTGVDLGGLWAGYVTLNQVSEINSEGGADANTPQDTGSEFTFRLLLHHDGSTTTKILNQAVEVLDGVNYVIYSDNIDNISSENCRRRISAPTFGNFGGGNNLQMTPPGAFGVDGSILEANWTMAADDPLNPFIHAFNHEHRTDNTSYGSYAITRDITLTFGGGEDGSEDFIGWGSSEIGGVYEETFQGLTREDNPGTPDKNEANIYVKGTFRLRKISDIKTLNPAP